MRKDIIEKVINKKLSYLHREALEELMSEAERCSSIEGIMVETGCAWGGSGICIASTKNDKKLYIYDGFEMIPAPSGEDGEDAHQRYETISQGKSKGINGNEYYGYQEDLFAKVEDNFKELLEIENLKTEGIYLIKGSFENTLFINEKVAFAHIDCDWYKSVKISLEQIVPKLSKDGTIIIDDYFTWSGCKRAVDEYFIDNREQYIFSVKSRLHITKK